MVDASERMGLAVGPRVVEPRVAAGLFRDECVEVRAALAGNPLLPVDALEVLARDADARVRCVVAASPRVPVRTMLELAVDVDEVASALAGNPVVPEGVGVLLLQGSAVVRAVVAQHARLPDRMVAGLRDDPSPLVRRALSLRPGLPEVVFSCLVVEEVDEVVLAVWLEGREEREAAAALAPGWQGTVAELVDAARLVQR